MALKVTTFIGTIGAFEFNIEAITNEKSKTISTQK